MVNHWGLITNAQRLLLVLGAALALLLLLAAGARAEPSGIGQAISAQERHTDALLSKPGVVGTAVGLTSQGTPTVDVYTTGPEASNVPGRLDGVPVSVEVTGKLSSMRRPGGGLQPSSRWPRPVPIGVSTGNEGECSAGTIGARVTNGAAVYSLSNNHVYALENDAPIGSRVLQPGLLDTGCAFSVSNVLGTLTDFQPIVFSSAAANTIDAAIALSSTADLGNATPPGGYGLPKSAHVVGEPTIGWNVQKYGRSSALTRGTITAVNATVLVSYSSGTARFVDQVIVESKKPFSKSGDSGSLIVRDPERNPVGLLFAGDSSGKFTIANRIDLVLARFGVTVDGE
jgi:hypothetical protein